MSAVDAQLIDQLKWTAENVCVAFHVSPSKIFVTSQPTYNNVEAIDQNYYSETLQNPIECIELLLDEGLGLTEGTQRYGVEFDLDGLMRMDTSTRVKAAQEAINAGMTVNEARFKFFDLGPVTGGDAVYLQQQNYSLEALAKRDASANPFAMTRPAPRRRRPTPRTRTTTPSSLAALHQGCARGDWPHDAGDIQELGRAGRLLTKDRVATAVEGASPADAGRGQLVTWRRRAAACARMEALERQGPLDRDGRDGLTRGPRAEGDHGRDGTDGQATASMDSRQGRPRLARTSGRSTTARAAWSGVSGAATW